VRDHDRAEDITVGSLLPPLQYNPAGTDVDAAARGTLALREETSDLGTSEVASHKVVFSGLLHPTAAWDF